MKTHGFPLLLSTLFLAAGHSAAEERATAIVAAVGAELVLYVDDAVDSRSGAWHFGCTDVALWIGNATDISNDYTGRAELLSNGSLILRSLKANDSGDYLTTFNPPFSNVSITSTFTLTVLVPVSKPTVVTNLTQTVEGNETVSLYCQFTGDLPSVAWRKDGDWLLYHDRMNISDDNRTLTITVVNRTDSGQYQCEAQNPVSEGISDQLLLTVYYGPEDMAMSLSTADEVIAVGSNVTFLCSAQSDPPPHLEWLLNGDILDQKGPRLNIVGVLRNNSGNYTCQAYNNMTGRYTSLTTAMQVIEPVSKPIITSDISYPVENNDTVTLTCTATGDITHVGWILPNDVLLDNEDIKASLDNVSLSLSAVQRSDSGLYRCQVWSVINNETSDPFSLTISYGPDSVRISAEGDQEFFTLGSNLTLSCSADSVPAAEYNWLLNGRELEESSREFTIINMTRQDLGNYTCHVYNNRTRMYAEATKFIATNGISVPKISASVEEPVERNGTVTLVCDVSGQLLSVTWTKDQQALSDTGNTRLSEGNRTLTINDVDRANAGNYTCEALGPLGSKASQLFHLNVYYGPDEPQIVSSPDVRTLADGENVTLTCRASSFPASVFQWYLNGNSLVHPQEQLVISNLRRNNTGNYTCETFNSKTNLVSRKSIQLHLTESNDLADYGNKSWIAAAVVGCLVIIAISACAFFRNKN